MSDDHEPWSTFDQAWAESHARGQLIETPAAEWAERVGLLASEYPLSDLQWITLHIQRMKATYPERCNWYCPGHGVCAKATKGPMGAHADGIGSHSYFPIPDNPTKRKGTDMPSKTATQIALELRAIEDEEAKLLARKEALLGALEKRAALPAEPPDDSIIKFQLQYGTGGISYTVVAFRSRRNGAHWHTTLTRRPGPYTWDDMLSLMQDDVGVKAGARSLEFFLYKPKGEWVR